MPLVLPHLSQDDDLIQCFWGSVVPEEAPANKEEAGELMQMLGATPVAMQEQAMLQQALADSQRGQAKAPHLRIDPKEVDTSET